MTTLKFTGDLGAYQGIIFALLVSAAAWFLYYRQIKNRPDASRFVLPTLRAFAIFLLIMMLTQPIMHHKKTVGELGRLFVIIDSSKSMMLKDIDSESARKVLSACSQGNIDNSLIDQQMIDDLTRIEQAHLYLEHELSGKKSINIIKEQTLILSEALASCMKSGKNILVQVEVNPKEIKAHTKRIEEQFKGIDALLTKYLAADDKDKLVAAQELLPVSLAFERDFRLALYAQAEALLSGNPEAVRAISEFDSSTRWSRLQNTLFEGEDPLLDILAENHEIELINLKGNKIETLWRSNAGRLDEASDVPDFLSSIPNSEFTDLSAALSVKESKQNSAILLLSDGHHNHGESPLQRAKILGNKGIKVYTVGYGSANEPQDMAIQDISVPQSVYIKDRVRGSMLFSDRMKPGQEFTVKMVHEDKVLWEKDLVSDGSGMRRLSYDFPVEEAVKAKLEDQKSDLKYKSMPLKIKAKISFLKGDRQRNNNTSEFNVMVATRKRSILMIDQRPRWEWRYLKTMFERDLKWEMNAVLPVDNETRFEHGNKKGMLPEKKEELMSYELVFLGDVNSRLFKKEELEWLAEFVEKRGGGLIMLDGRRNNLKSFEKTPLENLIPVKWKSATGKRKVGPLMLTETGKNISALELGSEEEENQNVWKELPKVHWVANVEALPGTETFLEEGKDKDKSPVMVFRRFGAGKVLYTGTEDFWRWRFKKGDFVHQRLWNQITGWVMEKPFAVQDKHVAIDAGSTSYDNGDKVDIRTRIRDKKGGVMLGAEAEVHLIKDENVVAKLPLVDGGGGLYTARTEELVGGDYKVRVHVKGLDDFDMRAEARFSVKEPKSAEMSQLTCNEKLLQDIAVNSNGVYVREEQIRDIVKQLKPLSSGKIVETDTALWQSYWYFLIVIFLFTTEWIWRKRKGMI